MRAEEGEFVAPFELLIIGSHPDDLEIHGNVNPNGKLRDLTGGLPLRTHFPLTIRLFDRNGKMVKEWHYHRENLYEHLGDAERQRLADMRHEGKTWKQ